MTSQIEQQVLLGLHCIYFMAFNTTVERSILGSDSVFWGSGGTVPGLLSILSRVAILMLVICFEQKGLQQ
jgi:hypothetical protein